MIDTVEKFAHREALNLVDVNKTLLEGAFAVLCGEVQDGDNANVKRISPKLVSVDLQLISPLRADGNGVIKQYESAVSIAEDAMAILRQDYSADNEEGRQENDNGSVIWTGTIEKEGHRASLSVTQNIYALEDLKFGESPISATAYLNLLEKRVPSLVGTGLRPSSASRVKNFIKRLVGKQISH